MKTENWVTNFMWTPETETSRRWPTLTPSYVVTPTNVTRTYVDEAGVGRLSDATAAYDEGGFNYESRRRLTANTDGLDDPVTRRKFDWAGNVTEWTEYMLGPVARHVRGGSWATTAQAEMERTQTFSRNWFDEASDLGFRIAGVTSCNDGDGDGYGFPSSPGCPGTDYRDCNDADATIYPGAPEVNDGLDNQCPGDAGHGIIDETSGLSGFTNAVQYFTRVADAAQPAVI